MSIVYSTDSQRLLGKSIMNKLVLQRLSKKQQELRKSNFQNDKELVNFVNEEIRALKNQDPNLIGFQSDFDDLADSQLNVNQMDSMMSSDRFSICSKILFQNPTKNLLSKKMQFIDKKKKESDEIVQMLEISDMDSSNKNYY